MRSLARHGFDAGGATERESAHGCEAWVDERDGAAAIHLLVYNDPDDPSANVGMGWTLITRRDTTWYVASSLTACGAGAHATVRTAKATAERMLARQGVAVEAWVDDRSAEEPPAGLVTFLALERLSTQLVPEPRRAESPTPLRLRLRYGGVRGH